MSIKIYSKSISRANRRRTLLLSLAAVTAVSLISCSPHTPATKPASEPVASTPGGTATAGAKASDNAPASDGEKTGSAVAAAGGEGGSAGSGAYVSFVTGNVESTTSTAGAASPPASAASVSPRGAVHVADPVLSGETLTTSKASAAEVRVGKLFDFGLGESSVVRVERRDASHLTLTLLKGSIEVKAGSRIVSEGSIDPNGHSASSSPLLLEIHTPHLFVTSRGGSLAVTVNPDSTLCAVGLGQVWLLPESVVYSDIIGDIANQEVLRLLDSILSKAVAVSKHQQITVAETELAGVDKVGATLRRLLLETKGRQQLTKSEGEDIRSLAEKAAGEVEAAIGTPGPLSDALRKELDPASVHQRTMKTESSSSPGPGATTRKSPPSPSSSSTSTGATPGGAVSATPPAGAPTSGRSASSSATSPADGSGGFPGPTPPSPPTPPTAP